MAYRSFVTRTALLAFVLGFIGSEIEADVVDLFGVDEVTLTWTPASGPVSGYYVIVDRNGGEPTVEKLASEPTATLAADFGDEIGVAVAAFDASGVAGPLSPRSDTLRFQPASDDPPPPQGDDPPPPPDEGDPAPTTGVGTPLDFTGDGISDLMLRASDGPLDLVTMEGAIPVERRALPHLDTAWSVVGNGDYDGNGLADLLWEEDATGRLVVWGMHGGEPDAGVVVDVAGLAPEDAWRVGTSGDFDGDGHDDVLLFSRVLGEVELLHLRDGVLASQSRLPGHAGAWSVATSGDLDGDGIDEVVWRDEIAQELVVWQPDLGGADTGSPIAAAADGRRVDGSGDFDGDGRADLFLTLDATGQLEVWRMDGPQVVGVLSVPDGLAGGWQAAGVGDYDADGRADLVWSDPGSGGIEIWFSDGSGVTRKAVTSGVGAAEVVSGSDGSDDTEFLARLCGDFDADGAVDANDVPFFRGCLDDPGGTACYAADMNGDGAIDAADVERFRTALERGTCVD